jgi:hypothetical protein
MRMKANGACGASEVVDEAGLMVVYMGQGIMDRGV